MKILIVTGCVYARECNRATFTGLDIVVHDIAKKIGENNEVIVFTLTPYPAASKGDNFSIKSYKYSDLIRCLMRKDLLRYLKIILKKGVPLKSKLREIRHILITRYLEKYVANEKFDFMHFHGINCITELCAAINNRIPYLITLHGLISFDENVAEKWQQNMEQEFLKLFSKKKIFYSVVSSGVKNRINSIPEYASDQIRVILNALPQIKYEHIDVIEKYGLDLTKDIVTLIGTISERKNQLQFLRALRYIPAEVQERLQIYLLGKDDLPKGYIDNFIYENNLDKIVFKCGFVSKSEIEEFLELSKYNILISLSEGFGMSVIEAKIHGTPSMVFADMDGVPDFYSKDSMILVEDKSDKTVAETFLKMLEKQWDPDMIRNEAQKFSDETYLEYVDLYEEIRETGIVPLSEDDVWEMVGVGL